MVQAGVNTAIGLIGYLLIVVVIGYWAQNVLNRKKISTLEAINSRDGRWHSRNEVLRCQGGFFLVCWVWHGPRGFQQFGY